MKNWVRRMLSRWTPEDLPAPIVAADRVDLARAKVDQKRIMTRADVAIQEAMAHADDVFVNHERRRKPR